MMPDRAPRSKLAQSLEGTGVGAFGSTPVPLRLGSLLLTYRLPGEIQEVNDKPALSPKLLLYFDLRWCPGAELNRRPCATKARKGGRKAN